MQEGDWQIGNLELGRNGRRYVQQSPEVMAPVKGKADGSAMQVGIGWVLDWTLNWDAIGYWMGSQKANGVIVWMLDGIKKVNNVGHL